MDATTNATNNYGYGYGYGQPMYQQPYGYDPNPYFAYQPMMQPQNMRQPQNQNALTPEEIQKLRNDRPNSNVLNLNIDPNDILRGVCTHKDNGRDVVQMVQDGSGDVYCPICGERWNPESMSKEEVEELVNKLIAQMQNAKWTGEFPANVVREYFTMIPLLRKFPDLYQYGAKNFESLLNQRGYYSAGDANIYAQYNSLWGPGMGYGQPMYQNPYMANQPMGGYYQQPVQQQNPAQAQPASPNVNPMQAPVYGTPGFNPQFANQANNMMGGTYYQQPAYGAPVYATPQQPVAQPAAQPQQAAPAQATAQPAQQPAQQTTNVKVDL